MTSFGSTVELEGRSIENSAEFPLDARREAQGFGLQHLVERALQRHGSERAAVQVVLGYVSRR